MSRVAGVWRILLEVAHDEPGPGERRDDLAEPPVARLAFVGEVILAPVHQAVDSVRRGMVVEHEHVTLVAQRRGNSRSPRLEIVDRLGVPGCVDEIEAAASQLARQVLYLAF